MKPSRKNPPKAQNAGSPASGEPVFLAVGRLGKPHGVRGEISMQVHTDFPERLTPGSIVYIGPDHQQHRIQSIRWHRDRLLIKFDEYPHREAVGALRNLWVLVPTADRPPLPEGEYYHHELIGLEVHTVTGEPLGQIREIIQTGANDVFLIRSDDGKELLLPWTDEVIQRIDLESSEVLVQMIPGLR